MQILAHNGNCLSWPWLGLEIFLSLAMALRKQDAQLSQRLRCRVCYSFCQK